MEPLYIIMLVIAALFFVLAGFGWGEKSKRKECDQLRIKLCDAYRDIENAKMMYQKSKDSFWKLSREYVELSNANKLMRKANEEIAKEEYSRGLLEGHEAGYKMAWKEVGEVLVKESVVLKNGSIIKQKLMPHQLVDVKC